MQVSAMEMVSMSLLIMGIPLALFYALFCVLELFHELILAYCQYKRRKRRTEPHKGIDEKQQGKDSEA